MGASDKLGFTILETMLFLAITGVMVVAILVSTGSTINIQRYRDSVTSLKSYLQGQYSDVINVRNEKRTIDLSCDSNAVTSETTGVKNLRGQAECTILGRYVEINDKNISASTVLGRYVSSSPNINDIDDLKLYKMSILSNSLESSELEWGTRIAWPASGPSSKKLTTPRMIAILIVRSPSSGLVYTFTSDNSNSTTLNNMIIAGNVIPGQSQRKICVDSDGLFNGGSMSVFINAYASGPSSIETRSNDYVDPNTGAKDINQC